MLQVIHQLMKEERYTYLHTAKLSRADLLGVIVNGRKPEPDNGLKAPFCRCTPKREELTQLENLWSMSCKPFCYKLRFCC